MDQDSAEPVRTGVRFAGEYLVPGGSNLVNGDFKQAGVHAILGLMAKSLFGLPGLLLVSANSFTKAVTGQHIYEHLGLGTSPDTDTDAAATRTRPARRTDTTT